MSRFAPKPISAEDCQKIIDVKLKFILSVSWPSLVYVFGSAGRKEMNDHSDVDLALIFDCQAELNSAREVVFMRPPGDEWKQDLLLYTQADFDRRKKLGGVCQIIAEEGVCLFEREKA